jgi:hypothetical protein
MRKYNGIIRQYETESSIYNLENSDTALAKGANKILPKAMHKHIL